MYIKILNFLGRERVDKFIGFIDRHHSGITFGLPMAAPAAAVPVLARGAASAGSRFWSALGSRVTPVGKVMLEKISFGFERLGSATASWFGFFAGRKGVNLSGI